MQEGDVVLIQDSTLVRGNWKLGRVSQVFPSQDCKVRKVEVRYKNPQPGEPANEYRGKNFATVQRPVHQLVVIQLPVDADKAKNGGSFVAPIGQT